MLIPSNTLVSDCCRAMIVYDDDDNYQCTKCMKPCESGGTLGEHVEREKAASEAALKQ